MAKAKYFTGSVTELDVGGDGPNSGAAGIRVDPYGRRTIENLRCMDEHRRTRLYDNGNNSDHGIPSKHRGDRTIHAKGSGNPKGDKRQSTSGWLTVSDTSQSHQRSLLLVVLHQSLAAKRRDGSTATE